MAESVLAQLVMVWRLICWECEICLEWTWCWRKVWRQRVVGKIWVCLCWWGVGDEVWLLTGLWLQHVWTLMIVGSWRLWL